MPTVADIVRVDVYGAKSTPVQFNPITHDQTDFGVLQLQFNAYRGALGEGISLVVVHFNDGSAIDVHTPKQGATPVPDHPFVLKLGDDTFVDRCARRQWSMAAMAYNYQQARAASLGCIIDACVCIPGIVEVMEQCTPFPSKFNGMAKPTSIEDRKKRRQWCIKMTTAIRQVGASLRAAHIEARDFKAENLVVCDAAIKVIDMSQLRKWDNFRPVCPERSEKSPCKTTPYVSTYPISASTAGGYYESPERVRAEGDLVTWWGTIVAQLYVWSCAFHWAMFSVKQVGYAAHAEDNATFDYVGHGLSLIREMNAHAKDEGLGHDLDAFERARSDVFSRKRKHMAGLYVNHAGV